jgi:hypothetical protein
MKLRILFKVVTVLLAFGIFYYLAIFRGVYKRLGIENGEIIWAWHIALPGYTEVVTPGSTIELERFSGTRIDGITVINSTTGKEEPEATAGAAFILSNAYSDYKMEQRGKHFVLYRPEKRKKVFSWHHWYRIGPWSKKYQ